MFLAINDKEVIKHYSDPPNPEDRLLLAFVRYLQHTNMFGKMFVHITNQHPVIFPKGSLEGIMGMVNRSEVDIEVTPVNWDEITMETVDFSYPYKTCDHTFVTFKPEYKPHIFGIF